MNERTMMASTDLDRFLKVLARPAVDSAALFNPYRDETNTLDVRGGAAIRRANLRSYLAAFARARFVFVGEAAGYNGCRFSGIPFTGEDLLVGERALPWAADAGGALRRSSRLPDLSSERSANIVWGVIGARRDVVLWNTVPWHPHREGEPLSNRKPRRAESEAGLAVLEQFLRLFPSAQPIAVGRVAEAALATLGRRTLYVRHPSMGGQRAFESAARAILHR